MSYLESFFHAWPFLGSLEDNWHLSDLTDPFAVSDELRHFFLHQTFCGVAVDGNDLHVKLMPIDCLFTVLACYNLSR